MKTALAIAAALVLMILANGCLVIESIWKRPRAHITSAVLRNVSFQEATLQLTVAVENTYSVSLPIVACEYALSVEEVEVVAGRVDFDRDIPSGETASITIPLRFRYEEILAIATKLADEPTFDYHAKTRLIVRAPFSIHIGIASERSGTMPVPRVPVFRVAGLRLGRSPAGKPTWTFRLQVSNRNNFALKILRLDYDIELQGIQVFSGHILPHPEIEPDGSGIVELQLTGGKPILALLAAMRADDNFTYKISGTLVTDTKYGPIETDIAVEGSGMPERNAAK